MPLGDNVITFAVQSGPGKVVGVHNGDAKSHEPQVASSRRAYHGLARAVVKVTIDSASAPSAELALLATGIETALGDGESTVRIDHASDSMHPDIVVIATSPGLKMGRVVIPVSSDAKHSVLAVAAASTGLELAFD